MEKYDLCIIGAGPSGYAAAMRSVDFGKKTLLIEKDKVGGAGLYNGALSSKTMWELSEKLRTVNERIKSVGGKAIDMSWEETQKTLMDATFDRKFQYSCHLKLLQSKALNNIFKYERGLGTFIDNHHVKIQKSNEEYDDIASKVKSARAELLKTNSELQEKTEENTKSTEQTKKQNVLTQEIND